MGPPPFDGGNFEPRGWQHGIRVTLQWGHRLSTVETGTYRLVVDHADKLQWGHRLSTVETGVAARDPAIASYRFNGATAFRRWKLVLAISWMREPTMLQWGHRLSTVETRSPRQASPGLSTRFNGATAFRRWKHPPESTGGSHVTVLQWGHRLSTVETGWGQLPGPGVSTLQWGHRLSTVETPPPRRTGDSRICASMGPPPFDGGNGQKGGAVDRKARELQWGHRLSTVETPKSST